MTHDSVYSQAYYEQLALERGGKVNGRAQDERKEVMPDSRATAPRDAKAHTKPAPAQHAQATAGAVLKNSRDVTKVSKAKGRHIQGERNKLEQAYEDTVLAPRKSAGEILGYWFEPLKLRLADRTYYTPDYLVMLADGTLEFHECKAKWKRKGGGDKAGWQEDSRVKFKIAAEQFPIFAFVAVAGRKEKGKGWKWSEERL